jgi:hypothetical protein
MKLLNKNMMISLFVFSVIMISGCSGNNSSQNPYANVCNSFLSGVKLESITPKSGSQFGDQQVSAIISGIGSNFTPTTVYLGNKARWITVTTLSSNSLKITFTTAGTPTAGTYPLVVADDLSACAYIPDAYTYTPPEDSVFKTFVAMGASYTAGFQSDSYNEIAQLNGPATWVARQAGAYFPIPLIKMPGLPPEEGFEGLDTKGNFTVSLGAIATELFTATNFSQFFEDPSVAPYNIAIPGATIQDEVLGPASKSSNSSFVIPLTNFLFAPYDNNFFETKDIKPEIVMAKELHPTLIMSTDEYGNDLLTGGVTPYAQFVEYITQAVSALASTGAQVFLANVPHAFALPSFQQTAINALANCGLTFSDIPGGIQGLDQVADQDNCAGKFSDNTSAGTCKYNACESLASIDQSIDLFNNEFANAVATYGSTNVHIVPFSALMNGNVQLAGQGVTFDSEGFPEYKINNVTLKMRHLGGFYSLDDLHLTNTGYAILAAVFIQTINDTLGTHVPLPDLPSILAGDPLSPPAISNYCQQPANSEKLYCQCVNGPGSYVSVTSFTCSTLLY